MVRESLHRAKSRDVVRPRLDSRWQEVLLEDVLVPGDRLTLLLHDFTVPDRPGTWLAIGIFVDGEVLRQVQLRPT